MKALPFLKYVLVEEHEQTFQSLQQVKTRVRWAHQNLQNCVFFFLVWYSGTGGLEASLFAWDLFKMYQNFARQKGWSFEVLSHTTSDLGGTRV